MKKLILIFLFSLWATLSFAIENHIDKTVQSIQFINDESCLYFSLVGVSVADSSVPGSGIWFTIPTSDDKFYILYSTLLTAKTKSLSVNVTTSGATACGGGTEVGVLKLN